MVRFFFLADSFVPAAFFCTRSHCSAAVGTALGCQKAFVRCSIDAP